MQGHRLEGSSERPAPVRLQAQALHWPWPLSWSWSCWEPPRPPTLATAVSDRPVLPTPHHHSLYNLPYGGLKTIGENAAALLEEDPA